MSVHDETTVHDDMAGHDDADENAPLPASDASSAGALPLDAAGEDGEDAAAGPSEGERLSPRVVPAWLLSGLFGGLVLAGIATLVLSAFDGELGEQRGLVRSLVFAVVGLALLWAVVLPPLAWRVWRFWIDARLLRVERGVVVREEKVIPISRLQHVDLTRGPIERLFGLSTLVVHTAGSEGATLRLPGLAVDRAAALRDAILEARGDDVV